MKTVSVPEIYRGSKRCHESLKEKTAWSMRHINGFRECSNILSNQSQREPDLSDHRLLIVFQTDPVNEA